MKTLKILFLLIALFFITPLPKAYSKDLANRMGVGYSNQFSSELPSLRVQYYPSNDIGLGAALGVSTESGASRFGFSGRIQKNIFPEEHMNFYMGAAAGLISRETSGRNDSGFELSGFVGSEFFIPGLDSLGWRFEAGVGITSVSSGVSFKTIADSPIRAGMLFYF